MNDNTTISEKSNTQSNQVNNAKFLQAVFGEAEYVNAHITGFNDDPSNLQGVGRLAWAGGHFADRAGQVSQCGNQYFTISTFNPSPDGAARRRKSLFKQTHAIVVDDVGVGLSAKVDPNDPRLLQPSYKLETSPGNEQWGYILSQPETDPKRVDNLLDGMVAAGITEDFTDPGQKGVTRYVRLPEGTNNKQKYIAALGVPFKCKLNTWAPFVTFSMEQLAEKFGIDLDAEREPDDSSGVDCEDHPGLKAYDALYGVKSRLGEGRYDVTCPNVHEHTDQEDSGAAVFTYPDGRLGYKCHHGHCEEHSGGWLMTKLFTADPELKGRVALFGSLLKPIQAPIASAAGPVTLENNTGDVVEDLQSIISKIDKESDANYIEWACQKVVYLCAGNRAAQSDWLKEIKDLSRYDEQTLKTMLTRARKELARHRNTAGVTLNFPHVNDSDNPLPTRANTELVAEAYGFRFRFNMMTRAVETERDLSHVPADVRNVAHLTDFEDLCMQHRLDDKRVQKHRDRMAFDNSYHPFLQYLEQERVIYGPYGPNDADEIDLLYKSLVLDGTMNGALSKTLLIRWLVSVIAAAHMKDENDYEDWEERPRAPRGVLVLQGEQYMGKTAWFNSITPKTMFKEGLQINHNDMNAMKTATNRLIVEIGEAEHATKGREANFMKTIIGRDVDELRLAFQKEEVRLVRRNVFCATVNPAEFLDDDQNTRYWAIKLLDIDFEASARVNIKRLWQQVYGLWEAKEPYHLTLDEMALLNVSNEAFRDCSDFEQFMLDTFDFDDEGSWMKLPQDELSYYTSTELKTKADGHGIRNTRDFTAAMKRLTGRRGSPKDNRGSGSMPSRKYWALPPEHCDAPKPPTTARVESSFLGELPDFMK